MPFKNPFYEFIVLLSSQDMQFLKIEQDSHFCSLFSKMPQALKHNQILTGKVEG